MLSEDIWKAYIKIEECANTLHDYMYDRHNHDKHERNQWRQEESHITSEGRTRKMILQC